MPDSRPAVTDSELPGGDLVARGLAVAWFEAIEPERSCSRAVDPPGRRRPVPAAVGSPHRPIP